MTYFPSFFDGVLVAGAAKSGNETAAFCRVPNAQIDQFIYALLWKAGPIAVLCVGGAIVVRELLRRLGRRARRVVREPATDRKALKAPNCPSCHRSMVKRTVRRGPRAGSDFWGCSNYPACTDTRTFGEVRMTNGSA